MERVPEPELMDDAEQALAYASADFEAPHERFVELFAERFPARVVSGPVLDLGCGPCDITLRFARAYPRCRIDALDGAAAMLAHGRAAVERAGLGERITLIEATLPQVPLTGGYATVISNSLLHHLHEPAVLWRAVREQSGPGAAVFVMDLMRPASRDEAQALKATYAADEPPVLQRDFFNSLLAAFRPGEVREQLAEAGLGDLTVETVSDRHLIVWGYLP